MKDYLVWLSSGSCIEGSMNAQEAEKLKQSFKDKYGYTGVIEFNDTDGILLVEMGKVDVVFINDQIRKEKIGFMTNTP